MFATAPPCTPIGISSSSSAPQSATAMALCASCDRCRARKTKCDGGRPCTNCKSRYLKKHKLSSAEGLDVSVFECVYSPAKRRGPVPGRSGPRKVEVLSPNGQTSNKILIQQQQSSNPPALHGQAGDISNGMMGSPGGMLGAIPTTLNVRSPQAINQNELLQKHLEAQKQQLAAVSSQGGVLPMQMEFNGMEDNMNLYAMNPQQRQQLLLQQQLLNMQAVAANAPGHNLGMEGYNDIYLQNADGSGAPMSQRVKMEPVVQRKPLPRTVATNAPLLEESNLDGNRLRAYFNLSINELWNLPPIPSDDVYCSRLPVPMKPSMLPRFDVAALQAARFSEVALGALANNQVVLALELSNATVMCLRECVEEPVHPSCMLDVSRAYFLHGMFRSFRGDMKRYFKYRRVALTHLSQLDNVPGVESLLSAMSFHDSWAYMIHNASDTVLPNIDDIIPPLPPIPNKHDSTVEKFGISSAPSAIASHPDNQMWIQGPPPIFINNKAPPLARSLDALAFAMRSCCDQANNRGATPNNATNSMDTPTSTAVLANQNELCPRNMVLSAFTLLQLHEASTTGSIKKNRGHHLIISAMDAFLEGGDEEEPGGFTDSQIQSLLSVCNTVIEHPLLLHQPGPTYHMVSNAAILLCHLLNGMYSTKCIEEQQPNPASTSNGGPEAISPGDMEAALFEEVLDTFLSIRKLLNIHRRKLPTRLRCHGIPRPTHLSILGNSQSSSDNASSNTFIDLGETIMCSSKACQGFVLMACSPCVAAERAAAATADINAEIIAAREAEGETSEECDVQELGAEFDLDDDALLNVLSRIIST